MKITGCTNICGPVRGIAAPRSHERPAVEYDDLASETGGECSADIRARVLAARAIQQKRYQGTEIRCNAQIPSARLRGICRMEPAAAKLLRQAFTGLELSARTYDRILRVSLLHQRV